MATDTTAPKRTDILPSDDDTVCLRAWLGDWDMGGWPNNDEAAFRVALADEAKYARLMSEGETAEDVAAQCSIEPA